MNRREALTSIVALAGGGALAKEIPAEPKPLFFVMEFPESASPVSQVDAERIQTAWNDVIWQGKPRVNWWFCLPAVS